MRLSAGRLAARTLSGVLVLSVSGAPTSAAAPTPGLPDLRLINALPEVTVHRPPGVPAGLDLGVRLAAVGQPLDVRVRRTSLGATPVVEHAVVRSGQVRWESVPGASISGINSGLDAFFVVSVTNDSGTVVAQGTFGWCPSGYGLERIDDSGPATAGPESSPCAGGNPFARGSRYVLPRGWAMAVHPGLPLNVPDGHYRARFSISPAYVRTLDGRAGNEAVDVGFTVVTDPSPAAVPSGSVSTPPRVVDGKLDPKQLPDLIALPSWGISVGRNANGRDLLSFGATIWNAGPSPMAIEAYRHRGSPTMVAYQYFYRGGIRVGRSAVGRLEYDTRDGHNHWHLADFARYRLLDESRQSILRSAKQGFCLTATEAIDLTVTGADPNPVFVAPGNDCGQPLSIWTREVLDAGWGDTYVESLPGQSFDVTDVPNGTYYIEIVANPLRNLWEVRTSNDRSLRRIVLGGLPGARAVSVPPINGVDTETGCPPLCG